MTDCMVLIFESADSGWLMAEAAGHMREQGAYVLVQRENLCEIAVIAPTRMTVEMRAKPFFKPYQAVVLRTGDEPDLRAEQCAVGYPAAGPVLPGGT